MAKVELKRPIIDEIKGYASDASAAVLVDYRGLTVEQDTQLRKKLREAGVGVSFTAENVNSRWRGWGFSCGRL